MLRRSAAVLRAGWLAGAALAGGTALAEPPAVPVYREFKDWIVGCDNLRACTLKSAPQKERADAPTLEIWREAGPRGDVRLRLSSEAPIDPARLRVDGKSPPAGIRWRFDADTGSHRLQQDEALRFLRGIVDGAVLRVAAQESGPAVSLQGLAATLLFVDDVQARVGNSTALARAGSAPAGAVPAAPPMPRVRAAPTAPPLSNPDALAKAVRAAQGALIRQRCDPALRSFDADEAMPLTADEALVVLTCWRAAYQEGQLVLRTPRNAPAGARPVELPPMPGAAPPAGKSDPAVLTEAAYEPESAQLSATNKGRGRADCGSAAQWTFDGRRFVASGYSEQRRCAGNPEDWLPLYRTQPEKGG